MLRVNDAVRIKETRQIGWIDIVSSEGEIVLYYRVNIGSDMFTMKNYTAGLCVSPRIEGTAGLKLALHLLEAAQKLRMVAQAHCVYRIRGSDQCG